MTHKEKCVCNCREHLQSRGLLHVFNPSIFQYYYRKHNGAQGNAFLIGLNTADMMIQNFKPAPTEQQKEIV